MTSAVSPGEASARGAPTVAEVLAVMVQARQAWLSAATGVLAADARVRGVWLCGSLGRGEGDAFSDIDLIVTTDPPESAGLRADPFAGLHLPGAVLYSRPKPRNAPGGGAYLAVCLELAGLPVLVDLYLWPATTAVLPEGGRVLFQRGEVTRSPLGLVEALAECPADDPAGADPHDPASVLFLIQLAAKYHARCDHARYAGICRQLQIPDDDFGVLRQLVAGRASSINSGVVLAAGRLLHIADAHRRLITPPSAPSSVKGAGE